MYELNSPLFKSRSVFGRLSASFKFVNDHLGLLLRVGSMALLPASVLWALYVSVESLVATQRPMGLQLIVGGVVLVASMVLLCGFQSLLYAWIRQYADGKSCAEYAWRQLLVPVKQYAGKVLVAGAATMLALLLCIALCWGLFVLSPYTLIGTLPVVLFILVPLSYLPAIYILDDCSVGAALSKSFRMGVSTWGATFAVLLVVWVVCGLLIIIGSLPFVLGTLSLVSVFTYFPGEAVLPAYFPFMMFLFAALGVFISGLAHSLVTVAIAFQYGSVEAHRLKWERESQSL